MWCICATPLAVFVQFWENTFGSALVWVACLLFVRLMAAIIHSALLRELVYQDHHTDQVSKIIFLSTFHVECVVSLGFRAVPNSESCLFKRRTSGCCLNLSACDTGLCLFLLIARYYHGVYCLCFLGEFPLGCPLEWSQNLVGEAWHPFLCCGFSPECVVSSAVSPLKQTYCLWVTNS